MKETRKEHEEHHKHDHRRDGGNPERKGWGNIHHSWVFWVAVVLMFAGILYYILSVSGALLPGNRSHVPLPAAN